MRTYNNAIDNLKPSASIKYIEKAKIMKMNGEDVIGLSGGDPDFPTPKKICDAAYAGMVEKHNTHYTLGAGLPEFREKIAEKLRTENHINCTKDNILVTPGGKCAIYTAVRAVLNPGDEVLCPEPNWVSYEPIVSSAYGVPVSLGLSYENNYRISEQLLEEATTDKTRMIIVNYPCNPTGKILHEDEALEIVSYLKKHPDVLILSDEIYEKVIFDGHKHISLASFEEIADQVITINGFSKCAAMTGWRLGYACASQEVLGHIMKLWQHMMTCTSGFIQDGGMAALDCQEEMNEMCRIYQQRRDAFIDRLNEIPCVTCEKPEGTFYAWVKFDIPGMTSYEICDYLLDNAKVSGVPGDAYGKGGNGCMRFSFANSMEDLMEAADRIKAALEKLN